MSRSTSRLQRYLTFGLFHLASQVTFASCLLAQTSPSQPQIQTKMPRRAQFVSRRRAASILLQAGRHAR